MSRAGLARLYAQTMVGISRAFLQFTKIKMIQNVTKAEEQLVKSVSKTGGGKWVGPSQWLRRVEEAMRRHGPDALIQTKVGGLCCANHPNCRMAAISFLKSWILSHFNGS